MKKREKKRKKKVGSSCKSVPENDATDDKWLDTLQADIQEMISAVQSAIAYAAAHPPCLSIPDIGTEKEFLEKAKQVYREAHIPDPKRGRRPVESVAIDKLSYFSHELRRQPTQGIMIKLLIDDLNLSKNTAGKYAKLFRLSQQGEARFSQADQRWLCKNFGSESLSPAWWEDRRWGPWMSERLRSSGLGEEIRKIFAGEYTPTQLQQERDKMEMLRLQLNEKYANQRQQAGFTNAKNVLTKKPRPRPKMKQRTPG